MAKASEKQLEYAQHISQVLNIEMPSNDDRFVIGAFISKNKDAALVRQEEMNQELYTQIREQVKITDMAREMGMTLTRKGSYYSTQEYDSIRIKPSENIYFRNSRGNRGTVIDFVMEFTGKDKMTVIQELSNRIQGDYKTISYETPIPPIPKEKPEFVLPPKSTNMRNTYAYLVQTRYLDPEVVQELAKGKYIYQDERRNCVFVSYKEGEAVFATTVGTNTFAPYKGDIPGSDYSHCWHVDNGSNKLYVTEAPIDAISKMSILKAAGQDYKLYDYLSLTGTGKYEAVFHHLKSGKYSEVWIGTDNDWAGIKCLQNIKSGIQQEFSEVKVIANHPILTKDWNDEIKYLFMKGYRFDGYISPSAQLVDILQDEVKALLEGNMEEAKLWKKALRDLRYPEELQAYTAEYLLQNREVAIEDVAQGKTDSVKNIINNYNKKIKLHMPTEQLTEQECKKIKDDLLGKQYKGTYLTSEQQGFNEGIRLAASKIAPAQNYEIIKNTLASAQYKGGSLSNREVGFNKGIFVAATKVKEAYAQNTVKTANLKVPIMGQGIDI